MMAELEFSDSIEDVISNLHQLQSLAEGTPDEQKFHRIRVSNAEHHVVAKTANGLIFAPIKWCGIRNSRRHDYADKKYKHTNRFKRLLSNLGLLPVTLGQKSYHDLYSTYCKYCSRYGFIHSNSGPRTFWVLETPNEFPETLDGTEKFLEGAKSRVTVNAYERNPGARRACIAHHGCACAACGILFAEKYGSLGEGFIHVHHNVPASKMGEGYEVDPQKDLVPVCPNCHAMLHRRQPLLSIDELRSIMQKHNI